jgi:glycosyltransferase involved in cell wall biosynthesis
MRALHIQKAKGVSGSERHLLALLPSLAEAGVDVRMIVVAAPGAERFVDALRATGVDTITLRAGPDVNPLLLPAIWREIRRFGPDLVHTHLIHADLHAPVPSRVAGVPCLSSMHGMHPFFRRAPWRTLWGAAHSLNELTIAISDEVARFLAEQRLARPDRIRVVRYGIDPHGWGRSPEERERARERLGLEPGDVAVGMASRLVPGKGHDLALAATAAARAGDPRLKLLIAGDGPLRAELERDAGEGVRLLGFLDGIGDLLAACDVFLFPTEPWWGEGFGLAALEAMASGLPIVATAVGGMPEMVEEGRTGMLVEPRDTDGLRDALAGLARDEERRRAMGREARARVEREFSLEVMRDRTLEVYREVLGAGERAPEPAAAAGRAG